MQWLTFHPCVGSNFFFFFTLLTNSIGLLPIESYVLGVTEVFLQDNFKFYFQ